MVEDPSDRIRDGHILMALHRTALAAAASGSSSIWRSRDSYCRVRRIRAAIAIPVWAAAQCRGQSSSLQASTTRPRRAALSDT